MWIVGCAINYNSKINKSREQGSLSENRQTIESYPGLSTTWGVLGTFFGITIGLVFFDPKDLDKSIPILLGGLSTAFFTSLCGMIGSIFLQRKVNKLYDEIDNGEDSDDLRTAVKNLSVMVNNNFMRVYNLQNQQMQNFATILNQMDKNLVAMTTATTDGFTQMGKDFNSYTKDNKKILNNIESKVAKDIKPILESINENIDNDKSEQLINVIRNDIETIVSRELDTLASSASSMNDSLSHIDDRVGEISTICEASTAIQKKTLDETTRSSEVITGIKDDIETMVTTELVTLTKASAKVDGDLNHIDDRVGELSTICEASSAIQQETLDETKRYSEVLRGEVDEIEIKMGETNKLLTAKFDEFSELLKKSNTEALVEVMSELTKQFQKQMNDLISKLVKENFDQLNKSVDKLNKWQKENKEMITELTSQYKNMSDNFKDDSVALNKVKDDTQELVGEGGKLSQLIAQLNKVMIDDTKFTEITKKLADTAELTNKNMVAFDDSTNKLNQWIRKQREFKEAVDALINKLEDINKIKDYSETFWKDTKKGMNESVGIINTGAKSLNDQLRDLDQHFYNRLNATLAELDACIQAMINRNDDGTNIA